MDEAPLIAYGESCGPPCIWAVMQGWHLRTQCDDDAVMDRGWLEVRGLYFDVDIGEAPNSWG